MAVTFHIAGHENRLPLASNKALYTNVFYHGSNLQDTIGSVFNFESANDNFARQNYLIRKPRVVRVLSTSGAGDSTTAFTNHYAPLFQALATAIPSICVCWGRYSGPFAALAQRWLNDATPDFAGAHSSADLVVGKIFTYVFVRNNFAYGDDLPGDYGSPLSGQGQQYSDDYDTFTAKHAFFESVGGRIYHGAVAGLDTAEIIARAVAGTAPLDQFGPGLGEYGWSITESEWDQPASYVPLATIRTEVEAFFGL